MQLDEPPLLDVHLLGQTLSLDSGHGSRADGSLDQMSAQVLSEAARRRTFAIISHPDAGKTTLTEKFLLYAGAITSGGAVKAHEGRRAATSDWMDMEQKRGISISSTALNFPYRDHELNLLDTPGHRDFSEDTYRVLAAVDAVVMVLDSAKGIEPQTLKLFEVCRSRNLPVITFLNKLDRPGMEPLELLDQIEEQIGLRPTPATWPVGSFGDLRGVIDRRTDVFTRFTRTARGSQIAPEEDVPAERAAAEEGTEWIKSSEETELLSAMEADVDMPSFLAGESTPVFAGSALTNFGVRHLLDAIVDLAPAPIAAPRRRRQAPPPRRAVFGVRVQGAGQHGPQPPRPHRVRPHLLGQVRPRHGDDLRAHRQAVRHQVRVDRVRRRAHHRRRGVPRRRGRPGQRHRSEPRRHALRRDRADREVPADPGVRSRGVRHGPPASTPARPSSSARASTSSTKRASSRC